MSSRWVKVQTWWISWWEGEVWTQICWKRLKAGVRAQHRMRWLDGITDSWAWVWANSRRWWRTGKPGVLQSKGTQRVRHGWATEQKTTKNTERRPCEDTGRRQPSTGQEEKSQEKPTLLTPWSQTLASKTVKKKKKKKLSHAACSTLLWQPMVSKSTGPLGHQSLTPAPASSTDYTRPCPGKGFQLTTPESVNNLGLTER